MYQQAISIYFAVQLIIQLFVYNLHNVWILFLSCTFPTEVYRTFAYSGKVQLLLFMYRLIQQMIRTHRWKSGYVWMQKEELHQNSITLRNSVAKMCIFPDKDTVQCICFLNCHLNFVIRFPSSTLSIMRHLKHVHFHWYDEVFCFQQLYVVLTETNTDTIWYHAIGKSCTKDWRLSFLPIPATALQNCLETWHISTHVNIKTCSCGWSHSLQERILTQGKKKKK